MMMMTAVTGTGVILECTINYETQIHAFMFGLINGIISMQLPVGYTFVMTM